MQAKIAASVAFRRRGKPGCRFVNGVIVNYTKISGAVTVERLDGGAQGFFLRRVFWLAAHDRANEPNGVYATAAPCEATGPVQGALPALSPQG